MSTESDRVMFEIYREAGYDRLYRVVYFTELSERNRDMEIGRAMAGEHLADGFIASAAINEAKAIISDYLNRLNSGETVDLSNLSSDLTSS